MQKEKIGNQKIFTLIMGQSPESKYYNENKDGLPFFQGKKDFGAKYPTATVWSTNGNKIAEEGDLLISVRAPVGAINQAKESCILGRGLAAIRTNSQFVDQEYLYFFLRNIESELSKEGSGSTFKSITKDFLAELEVPIFEIQYQKQIVSKIKECFTLLDKSEVKLKNAEAKSQILLDSILKKSLDINSAKVVELDEIATLINGDRGKNYPNKSALVKSGIPFITAGHIQNHKIAYDEMNYITEERYEILNSGKIQKDDILFCLRGSLGKIAIVEETNKGAIASSLVIIRPKTDTMSKYLYYYLLSQYGQNQIREYDNGTAQPNLSASNLKKFIIRVPEIDKQEEIIKQVEQFSVVLDAIKRNLLVQRDKSSNLRQSILKKAFEGKLI